MLRCFSAEHPALTLSEVARLTGLTRATARRLLLTFERLGYMRNDGRLFELTPLVLDLGYAYISSCKLPDLVQPDMEALSERVQRVGVGIGARRPTRSSTSRASPRSGS